MLPPPPRSTLFPYTTLFRSAVFNNIQFEGLRISSEQPKFDIQALGFGKETGEPQSMSKYPLVINNIMLRKDTRSEEHTSELQSRLHLVCRLLLEKKKKQR